MAAATRAGAVPPVTSAAASEPSIVAAARSAAAVPGSAASDRAVGSSAAGELVDHGRRWQVGEAPDPVPLRPPDERPDDVVGGAERDAAADERVGERRRGRVAVLGRGAPSARGRRASVSTSPAITASDASYAATAANSGGLSSWRSRW